MSDFSFERSLLICIAINALVFCSAWFLSIRRLAFSRSQALLDAALLWYAVQYISVGSAGLAGNLDPITVFTIAGVFSVGLIAAGWKGQTISGDSNSRRDRLVLLGISTFAVAFTLAFAHSQAYLPVISNDALTYHFPAAVQWIQQRRIGYFQTWFFNPANTYSPLAGSTFIAWLMLPFGNDLLARFVDVPALLGVGLAMYRLCRLLNCRASIAAIIAAAALLSRPIFTPCMMGKDDLFVAFFFIATLIALTPDRTGRRFAAVRLGISLGLLLATKYTVLLTLPILILAIDGPCWKKRGWVIAGTIAFLLAGPWYLHNWIATGNPVFPLALPHVFRGLFTTAASQTIASWHGTFSIVAGDQYGLPIILIVALGVLWIAGLPILIRSTKNAGSEVPRSAGSDGQRPSSSEYLRTGVSGCALFRVCTIGPVLEILLFHWRSPFPEVRFLLPVFLLLFSCAAVAIDRICRDEKIAIAAAALTLALSVFTLFSARTLTIQFTGIALIATAIAVAAAAWAGQNRMRQTLSFAATGLAVCIFAYINWRAYCREYLTSLHTRGSGYDVVYPDLNTLWAWADEHLPADAVVACSNTYLIYPLQGPSLRRHIVYAPTRANIQTVADLLWLGDHLPGDAIVPAAVRETVAKPDRGVWLNNLKQMKCEYVIVANAGHGGVVSNPPEGAMAETDSAHFSKAFSCKAGMVYRILNFSELAPGESNQMSK